MVDEAAVVGFGEGAGGASCATAAAARPNAIAVRTKGRKEDFMLDRPLDNNWICAPMARRSWKKLNAQ